MQKVIAAVLVTAMSVSPVLARTSTPQPPSPSVIGQFVRGLKPGTHIKLKLTNGAKLNGVLLVADDDAVSVKPKTRIPEPIQRVMLSDIADAEVGGGRMVGRSVALGAAVGAGAALGFLFVLVLMYGSD